MVDKTVLTHYYNYTVRSYVNQFDVWKESAVMAQKTMNHQVIKALSVGLAAFIALNSPMELHAAEHTDTVRIEQAAWEKAETITGQTTVTAHADTQYVKALEDAKYEFDLAQSVVGEKKWDYERALYAYETAQTHYRQYKKDNLRFWQWHDSQQYQDYTLAKAAYHKEKSSLENEETKMNEAEYAYLAMREVRA